MSVESELTVGEGGEARREGKWVLSAKRREDVLALIPCHQPCPIS